MTLSRSNTPLDNDTNRRELHESVQELDNLLEDLKSVQVSEPHERSHSSSLLNQHSSFSAQSLNSQATMYNQARPTSAVSPRPGGSSPSSSSLRLKPASTTAAVDKSSSAAVDEYTLKLEDELNKSCQIIPRGVFVKDVVEEEILVDHVLVPKHMQQSDKKYISTRQGAPDAQRAGRSRQVAFGGEQRQRYPTHHQQQQQHHDDDADAASETYDNTDNEEQHQHQHHLNPLSSATRQSATTTTTTTTTGSFKQQQAQRTRDQSASMQSINSAMTDQSEMTDGSSIMDPNKIINCYICGERVVGQVITALGRNYHREHFTCAHCNQELGTRNFYERDGLPYCEKDYQSLFSPKCAACQGPILDKVTIALEQTFHPEHFVCAHCGCQFDVDDGFHEKDGKPYCKDDFFDLFANKCASCALPITANYITALGAQWHPDCFVCSDCHCPFGNGKFFEIDGLPYCEIHYHARRGSLCAVCRQPIIGKCTTAMFRKFHPDHFTCTYCLKVLSKSFKEENDKPYCFECFDKLYS